MMKLLEYGNQYAKESDWKDFALVKFCLCSMGIMIGTQVTPKHRKKVIALSAMVFLITYIPLMAKFFKIVFEKNHENK